MTFADIPSGSAVFMDANSSWHDPAVPCTVIDRAICTTFCSFITPRFTSLYTSSSIV